VVAVGVTPPKRRLVRLLRVQLAQELQLRYIGSIAGIYWAVINPLLQVVIYVVLVAFIFKAKVATSVGKFDYAIFVLAGMAPWLAIQDGLLNGANSLIRHASIVRNVVFPLELLPMTAVVASLAPLSVGLVALGSLLGVSSGHSVGPSLVTLPLLIVLQLVFTLGFALVLAVLTVFIRDLQFILPVLFQVVLLITPILYSTDAVPHPLARIMRVNPLTYIVVGYRNVLYNSTWPSAPGLGYSAVFSLLLVGFGLLVFRRLKGYAEALV
jgi:ABC-type polysaccharide/polyol phosphate export permease